MEDSLASVCVHGKTNNDNKCTVEFEPILNVRGIAVEAMYVDRTWYNVNSNNNTFIVNNSVVTIPSGNYELASLLVAINARLSPHLITAVHLYGKIKFASMSEFTFQPSTPSCARLLGFSSGLHKSQSSLGHNAVISDRVMNLSYPSLLNLYMPEYSNHEYLLSVNSDDTPFSKSFGPREFVSNKLASLEVQVLDELKNKIPLNGGFIQFVLRLYYIQKKIEHTLRI